MIATHDEVGAPVVLPGDGVPDGLLGPDVAHRRGEHRHHRAIVRVVVLEQGLVAPHAHVGGDVVGLGRADQGMQEQAVHDLQGALLEVLVGAVHGVPRLEPDHGPPAPVEIRPRLGRRQL